MRHRGPIAPILKRHPLTGAAIEPVGVVNGKVIWPVMGGAPDDPDDPDDKGGNPGASGTGGDGDDPDPDDPSGDTGDKVDRAELDKILARMKAADKRADEAQAALKKIEDAKKDDLTKATDELTEAKAEIENLQSTVRTLSLQNAFLTANKHKWHDADTALNLAENQGYLEDAIDDEGKVDKVRLAKALDRLAKEKPFLVDSGKGKEDDPGEPSGEPAGTRSNNGKDSKAEREKLRKRFPVLNR